MSATTMQNLTQIQAVRREIKKNTNFNWEYIAPT
jgi:DNA-dependent RNA polymerase auxiliary subunit epsilon